MDIVRTIQDVAGIGREYKLCGLTQCSSFHGSGNGGGKDGK